MTQKRRTRNFGDVIRAELAADPQLAKEVAEEFLHAAVAQEVYRVRKQARLTQKELAQRIDTHQSVISRIEDADYHGHSLAILQWKVAFALNKELHVEFTDPPINGDEGVRGGGNIPVPRQRQRRRTHS